MTLATRPMPPSVQLPPPAESPTLDMLRDVLDGHEEYVPVTTEMYHAMVGAGFEDKSVELIEGVLIRKLPFKSREGTVGAGRRHARATQRLVNLDVRLQARGCHMQCQAPATLPPLNGPEPDGAVVRGSADDHETEPTVDDISCVFEVSDETLRKDRIRKLPGYARAGVPQYVIENLNDDVLEVHELPDGRRGTYADRTVLRRGDTLDVLLPDGSRLPVAVDDLLP